MSRNACTRIILFVTIKYYSKFLKKSDLADFAGCRAIINNPAGSEGGRYEVGKRQAPASASGRHPRAMGCCASTAPFLLTYVNLILMLYSGAGLATAARLKWDPSTYLVVRETLPLEYRVIAVGLTVFSFVLLLLVMLAITALRLHQRRRLLLIIYAVGMCLFIAGLVTLAVWCLLRLRAWLDSPAAQEIMEALELRHHVRSMLNFFSHWHPFPQKMKTLMEEAEADVPRNAYFAGSVVGLLAVLLPTAILLAAISAAYRPEERNHTRMPAYMQASWSSGDSEKAPLRTAYKNGRIVIL